MAGGAAGCGSGASCGSPPPAGCAHAAQSGRWPLCSRSLGVKGEGEVLSLLFGGAGGRIRSGCAPCSRLPARWACRLTPGHYDVCHTHGGLDILVEGRLHKLIVLLDDALDVPAPLADVTAQSPHKAYVGVRVHKDLHVQELWGGRCSEQLRANTGRAAQATGDRLRQRPWLGRGPRSGQGPQGSSGVWMIWGPQGWGGCGVAECVSGVHHVWSVCVCTVGSGVPRA